MHRKNTPIGLYRADITPIDRVIRTTVGRKHLLEDILEKLERNARKRGGQHYLFIGPRGIGKTHLLTLIENEVQQSEKLKGLYVVIRFPEENNRILSFADALLGIVDILAGKDDGDDLRKLYQSLATEEKDENIIDGIVPRLRRYRKETGKTLLLLVENLDTLLTEQIKRDQDIHRFRSFLMDSPCAALIGTSPTYFPGLSSIKSPLYDLFDITYLENLTEEESVALIRKNLEWEGRAGILANFENLVPKIKALHTMTGGNPRLAIMLYELIAHDNLLDVKVQFQTLLDQISPFYQDRLKELAPQERALVESIALMRDTPRTPGAIAAKLRMKPQQASSLLKRMTDAGYLTVADNPEDRRSRLYNIKEGFFDLWLAMSESRLHRKRLSFLSRFFEIYYRDRAERERKRKELWEKLEKDNAEDKKNCGELLGYLSDLGDEAERSMAKLEIAVKKLKDGDTIEAGEYLREFKSMKPISSVFIWMSQQANKWAENGPEVDVQEWLDEIVEFWKKRRSGELEKAADIAERLAYDLSYRGLNNVRLELLHESLKISKEIGDRSGKGKALNHIGTIHLARGEYEKALGYLEESLKIRKEIGDRSGEGVTLNGIGTIQHARGEYEKALGYLEESLKIRKEIGDRSGEGTTLNNISQIYDARGEYEKALGYLEESLKIRKEIGDRSGEGTTLNNISQVYDARGEFEKALGYLEESLKLRKEIGDRSGESATLNNISQIYDARGEYEKALVYLEESLKISKEIGNRSGEGTTLNNISQIYDSRGEYEKALGYLEESLKISKEIGNRSGEGTTLNNISHILYARGEYEKALGYLEESLKICKEIGNRSGEGTTLNNISQIYQSRGEFEKALEYLEESLKISKEIGDRSGEGTILNNISQIYRSRGEFEKALEYLERSLKIRTEIGDKEGIVVTLHNIASEKMRGGEKRDALALELEAWRLSVDLKHAQGLFYVGKSLGSILVASGRRDEGMEVLRIACQAGKRAGFPGVDEVEKLLAKYEAK